MSKKRWFIALGGFIFVTLFFLWQSAIEKNRQIPIGPFQIADNLFYVGTTNVTSFLLTGPEGHVLIDGAYPETAPMIIESISKLGYSISDVKILLNSHAHADHAGGLAELKKASGGMLWISEGDADLIEAGGRGDASFGPLQMLRFVGLGVFPAVEVDRRFADGDTIRLGPIELTANVTAGHTRGCTSWSFPVQDGDRTLLALNICSLTLSPFISLVEPETYPGIRDDFELSFRKLRSIPVDIFLASHTNWFKMQQKLQARTDSVNPFIDHEGYLNFIDRAENQFREVLAEQQIQ